MTFSLRAVVVAASLFGLSACASIDQTPPAGTIAPIDSVKLTAEGVVIDGAPSAAAFGASQADVIAALTPALNQRPVITDNPECPHGALTGTYWTGYLSTYFKDGRLVGWLTENPVLGTRSGVRLGAPLAEVEAFPDFTIPPTKANALEFKADGVSGFLTDGPEGIVQLLWAGEVCLDV